MKVPLRIAIALLAAAAVPVVRLQIVCGDPLSEACVWGKAYLPLAIGLNLLFLGPLLYFALWGIEEALRRR
jgi:hypothetical protein